MYESYATAWELVADTVPDADAIVHGPKRTSWRELEARAARFAGALDAAGFGRGAHVALFTHNRPEYLEAHFGTMKLRAVPVPVNFRYRAAELAHLLDDGDADVLVFERSLSAHVAEARASLPRLQLLIEVDDAPTAPLPGAVPYEDFLAAASPMPPIERSGDDTFLWFTGGTTGLPKGVVWHQGTLLAAGLRILSEVFGIPAPDTLAELAQTITRLHDADASPALLALTPLVHATALYQANSALLLGGKVVLLEQHPLDGDEVCSLIERERITNFAVIGDTVARRVVHALERAEAAGKPYDISSVRRIHNSGAMFSAPVKDALLSRGTMTIFDTLGSSEGTGFGTWLATSPGESATARFRPSPYTRVISPDGGAVPIGEPGLLATSGTIGIGYYNDPRRTAEVFRTIDGETYVVNGDWARLESDGTITLLGRGSGCINTGGEKVWPEEVEEVLKQHPRVVDAAVVGVQDAEWGETVGAVVSTSAGSPVPARELGDWVASRLAGYKRPRRIVLVDEVRRTTVSKVDLEWARGLLMAEAG